jgi:hypothetical protein
MGAEHVAAAFEAMAGADLTPAAKLLLVAYALHLGPDGTPTKSWRKLEKICGIKRPTTVAAAKTLKDAGLLDVVKKSNHHGSKIEPLDGSKNEPHWLKNLTTESHPLARDIINNQEINNTRSNAGARACVREETSKLATLCRAYPKRTFPNATIKAAWDDCLAEGITPEEMIACLGRAKLSKAWEEEGGRYIPKLVVWLNERRFSADLVVVRSELKRQNALKQAQQQEQQMAQWAMEEDDEPIEFA